MNYTIRAVFHVQKIDKNDSLTKLSVNIVSHITVGM
jgi:hypothetical protein